VPLAHPRCPYLAGFKKQKKKLKKKKKVKRVLFGAASLTRDLGNTNQNQRGGRGFATGTGVKGRDPEPPGAFFGGRGARPGPKKISRGGGPSFGGF